MPNQNDVLLNNGTNWILTSIEDFSLTINSTLPLADSIIRRTKTITNSSLIVPYISMTDSIYILTGSNTITLPSAVDNENVYRVIRSSLQSVYVASTNDELFNDANGPIILNINRMQIEFISDGVNWIY